MKIRVVSFKNPWIEVCYRRTSLRTENRVRATKKGKPQDPGRGEKGFLFAEKFGLPENETILTFGPSTCSSPRLSPFLIYTPSRPSLLPPPL